MVGTVIPRITEATRLDVSVGAAGQRITTTRLAAVREAAPLDPQLVAVARLVAPVAGHHLAVAEPGQAVAALAHHRRGRLLVAEAQGHRAVASARHPPEHHSEVGHPVVAALVQRGPGDLGPLVLVHHQVVLARRAHRLAEAHRPQEAPDRVEVSSAEEVALRAPVAVVSSEEEAVAPALAVEVSSVVEVAHAQVVEASLVVEAADVGPVDLVALEAVDDDRFSLCNRWRLGFDDASQQWL